MSLGYVLVWCMKAGLPWENASSVDEVLHRKQSTPVNALCEGLPGTCLVESSHSCGLSQGLMETRFCSQRL
jgi:hypothetical protein